MAIFPKIQSPCPVKNQIAAFMDGDTCRLCQRQVFDLSGMRDDERVAFMKGCSGDVCISYRIPVRPALVAAAIAAAAIVAPTAAAACDTVSEVVVEMGGIKDHHNLQYVQYAENPADAAIPALPVVYEAKLPPAAADAAAPAHDPVKAQP